MTLFMSLLLLVAATGAIATATLATVKTREPASTDQVVVYYFHRTLRCQTCLAIEEMSEYAITQNLADEITRGDLAWRPVNVDLDADAHFVDDFALDTQALVIAAYRDGALQRWEKLEEVWDLQGKPSAFDAYVLGAVRGYLGTPAGDPPAPAAAR